VALLAKNPRNGVNDVRFATAVGPDDASGTGAAKRDYRTFTERLKANDLDFSQLQQDVPFWSSTTPRLPASDVKQIRQLQNPAIANGWGKTREERRRFVPRGEGLCGDRSTLHRSPVKTFGRFSVRGPAAWRKDGGTGKNNNTMRGTCKAFRNKLWTNC